MTTIFERLNRFAPLFEGEGAGGGAGGGDKGAGGGGGDKGGGGGGGGGGDPWYMSAELGLDKTQQTFLAGKNPPDLKTALSSWAEADATARSRSVFEKPDPAKLKEWKHWSDLGWVPEAEKYVFDKPKVKDESAYDFGMEDHLRKIAHEERIPLASAARLRDGMVQYFAQMDDRVAAEGSAATAALQQALDGEWGANKAANVEISKRTAKALGINADDAAILDKILGSPGLVKMFHRIGSHLGEDFLAGGSSKGAGGAMTSDAAKAERLRLESDTAWMAVFRDPRHAQHKAYVARRDELLALEAKGKG